jgi:hypothetical protein
MPPSLRSQGSKDSSRPAGRATQVSSVAELEKMSSQEIYDSFTQVERCVAESPEREAAVKKQAAEEVAAAKAREEELLAELRLRTFRESQVASKADSQAEEQQVSNKVPEGEKTKNREDVASKSIATAKAEDAPQQVMAILSEMMSRLEEFQKQLEASETATSGRRPT